MSTASIRTIHTTHRQSTIDRIAVGVGSALVRWGRRAEVVGESHDERSRRLESERTVAEREHRTQRYGIAG